MEVIAGAVVVVIIQAGLEVIEVEVIVIPVLEPAVGFVVVAVVEVRVEKTILGKVVAQVSYVQIAQRRNLIFSVPCSLFYVETSPLPLRSSKKIITSKLIYSNIYCYQM